MKCHLIKVSCHENILKRCFKLNPHLVFKGLHAWI